MLPMIRLARARPRPARFDVFICDVLIRARGEPEQAKQNPARPVLGRTGFETRSNLYFGCSFSAAELMQYRRPVGPGPSLKTWPRWPSHFEHSTSVRIMPWETSRSSSTWLSIAGCEKLGQPQPESNLASDSNNVWPQPAQM